MTLVIPLEPRPGCHTAAQFFDTWSHELLQDKWAPFIHDIKFSPEPTKVVVSGLHAPMHQVKSLCLVTLQGGLAAGFRGMMKSMGTVGRAKDTSLLVVDIREEDEADFLMLAGKVPADIVQDWHGPTRAGSTTKEAKRLLYTGDIAMTGP